MTWGEAWPIPGWAGDPPAISLWLPGPGATVGRNDPILFRVSIPSEEEAPPILGIVIDAVYLDGRREKIFANELFSLLYRTSTRTVQGGDGITGWEYTIRRVAPWPGTFALEVSAEGNALPVVLGGFDPGAS